MSVILESEKTRQILSVKNANKIMFVVVLMTLFFVPVIPLPLHRFAYSILFTIIFLTGTQLISRNKKLVLTNALLASVMVWIADMMDLVVVKGISKGINVLLFIIIVLDLVRQVSMAKMVSPKVILESINGYLMIGLVFSVVVAFLMSLDPGSFSFPDINPGPIQIETVFHQYIYYAFITLTTVGYGDIVPLTPMARSLSILISVTGQLYIAVVIAVLVGKYISQHGRSDL